MDRGMSNGTQESHSTLFFCRMCQAVYRQPKILPCLHSFCRPCLVNAVTHGKEGTVVVCPTCSHQTKIPANGITGISDNCFLNRMCQEYVDEVKTNIAARSANSAGQRNSSSSSTSSEFTALRSRLSEELSNPRFSPSTSPRGSESGGRSRPSSIGSGHEDHHEVTQEPTTEVFTIDRGPSSGQTAIQAIRNMSKLQTKVMSLQGEALRVTYSIDHVNQCMLEWHQHKEDLKRTVQRRSAQFQFFIKRMERQLISDIENKATDDEYYAESDKTKTELRKILKNILHEVSVLKSVEELGKDAEINALSDDLLNPSTAVKNATLKKFHYDLDFPTKSIEEILADSFGKLMMGSEECNVFTPDVFDFHAISESNISGPAETVQIPPIKEEEEVVTVESKPARKSAKERRSRRHNTDLGLDSQDVKEYLAQFQNARETFRNRRREILQQGQQARDDTSPHRGEIRVRPRSSSRKGRVQSLDRSAMPVTVRGRAALPNRPSINMGNSEMTGGLVEPAEGASNPPPESLIKFQHGAGASHHVPGSRPDDISVPSPVIEETSYPMSPLKRFVKQTSEPQFALPRLSSPEEASGSELSSPTNEQLLLEQQRNRRVSSPNTSIDTISLASRRHSSEHLDLRGSRPLRKAISNAADKQSKMEYLRETWQRRKEILIQNEGFVSSEKNVIKQEPKPTGVKSPPKSPDSVQPSNNIPTIHEASSEGSPTKARPTPLASDTNTGRIGYRSRLDDYRQQLRERNENSSNNKAKEDNTSTQIQDTQIFKLPSTTAPRAINSQTSETRVHTVTPSTVPTVAITSTATVTTLTQPASTLTNSHERYSSTTSTTSDHSSRSNTQPSGTFDVASLIAAMYSGNEKSILTTSPADTTRTGQAITQDKMPASTTTTFATRSSLIRGGTTATPSDVGNNETLRTTPAGVSSTLTTRKETNESNQNTRFQYPAAGNTQQYDSRRYRSRLGDDSYGANRRHTIEIGKSTIQQALQAEAANNATKDTRSQVSTLQETTPAATIAQPPPSQPEQPRDRLLDRLRSGKPFNITQPSMPASSVGGVAYGAQAAATQALTRLTQHDSSVPAGSVGGAAYGAQAAATQALTRLTQHNSSKVPSPTPDKHSGMGAIPKAIPSPLDLGLQSQAVSQEQSTGNQQLPGSSTPTSQSPSQSSSPHSPSLTPTSPNAGMGGGRLREIARKKKERWRHLTIH